MAGKEELKLLNSLLHRNYSNVYVIYGPGNETKKYYSV